MTNRKELHRIRKLDANELRFTLDIFSVWTHINKTFYHYLHAELSPYYFFKLCFLSWQVANRAAVAMYLIEHPSIILYYACHKLSHHLPSTLWLLLLCKFGHFRRKWDNYILLKYNATDSILSSHKSIEKNKLIRQIKFIVSSECDLVCTAPRNPPKNHDTGLYPSLENAHIRHAL